MMLLYSCYLLHGSEIYLPSL